MSNLIRNSHFLCYAVTWFPIFYFLLFLLLLRYTNDQLFFSSFISYNKLTWMLSPFFIVFFPLFSLLFPFLLISFFFLFILNPNQLSLSLLCVCSSHAWRIRIQLGIRTRELHAYLVKILGFRKWRLAKEVWQEGLLNQSTGFFSSGQNQSKTSILLQQRKKPDFVRFHQFPVKLDFWPNLTEFFKGNFLR